MDWDFALGQHREALRRVLAAIVAMAALASGRTLPRRVHRAVLRLLRPAEAAARRLIIVAARREILPPGAFELARRSAYLHKGSMATGIVKVGVWNPGIATLAVRRKCSKRYCLPLLDGLRGLPRPRRRAAMMPRISVLGDFDTLTRQPAPRILSPDDPLDATRLHLRFEAIGRVLDDLPGQVRRFVLWQRRRDRQRAMGRNHRVSVLKPGRPPGWRKPESRRAHEVHRVLHDLHDLAFWALEKPDSS